ncbi:LacI family DNA-binding transcriptional regulator [Sanguibacter antarcticus]|uniref:LacI family transcriptional regulator n=1 Tax=Sanguibacter antarcticus TaxID=372484 RepID=A0A2A9E6E5_9MICO|nr:LacI family DNA-binding transcriptional regulator [Sanguibacter antarcticus]PFG34226.1 LacI family transcriptional regulator [Sanguibacter antarcticus]
MAVTLSDVAREAGVSLATASRAINGSADRTVRTDLRERVLAAAERLRYSPDANAQAMARGRTIAIGLIVHEIADAYFSTIASGVTSAAERAGLVVTLASTDRDTARELTFVDLMQRQRARAIILVGGRFDDDTSNDRLAAALAEYRSRGGGVAVIGQPLLGVDTVTIQNRASTRDLAHQLHGLGYRRFAVLAGPENHLTARERVEGFRDALAELGAPVPRDLVIHGPFTRDGGYDGTAELASRGALEDVELVFAVNDVMAVGAMAAARAAGLSIPGDVAFAGFDDILTLRDITPSLTTIRLPLTDMGAMVTEMALSPAKDEPRIVPVDGEVILRDSTPRLR